MPLKDPLVYTEPPVMITWPPSALKSGNPSELVTEGYNVPPVMRMTPPVLGVEAQLLPKPEECSKPVDLTKPPLMVMLPAWTLLA